VNERDITLHHRDRTSNHAACHGNYGEREGGKLWNSSSPGEQQEVIRSVFDQIVGDFDQKEVVDLKVNAWMENFILARKTLTLCKFAPGRSMTTIRTHDEAVAIFLEALCQDRR
jgi:hypothetical protein